MRSPDPFHYGWWLASRASGIVALGLITLSVGLGLAMAAGVLRRPGLKRRVAGLHEHVALAGLTAIAVHGLTLLGDAWLHPGVTGIVVPFAMGYRPLFTGLGIIGAYLAALLGLSFYARRRIGARLWRRMHRLTVVVYLLGVVHALGAGSDASSEWLRLAMLVTGAPILFLFLLRILPRERRAPARVPAPRPQAAREVAPDILQRAAEACPSVAISVVDSGHVVHHASRPVLVVSRGTADGECSEAGSGAAAAA